MSVIKAEKVEIEIQEQTDPGAACQYMTVVSYQPEGLLSKEIITLVLTDTKPFIKKTIDLGNQIVRKEEYSPTPKAKDGGRYYRSKLRPEGFDV